MGAILILEFYSVLAFNTSDSAQEIITKYISGVKFSISARERVLCCTTELDLVDCVFFS